MHNLTKKMKNIQIQEGKKNKNKQIQIQGGRRRRSKFKKKEVDDL